MHRQSGTMGQYPTTFTGTPGYMPWSQGQYCLSEYGGVCMCTYISKQCTVLSMPNKFYPLSYYTCVYIHMDPPILVSIDHLSMQKLHGLGSWASKKLVIEQLDFMKSAKLLQWTFMLDGLFSRITNFKDFLDIHRTSIISILKIVLSNIVTAYHLLILKNLAIHCLK